MDNQPPNSTVFGKRQASCVPCGYRCIHHTSPHRSVIFFSMRGRRVSIRTFCTESRRQAPGCLFVSESGNSRTLYGIERTSTGLSSARGGTNTNTVAQLLVFLYGKTGRGDGATRRRQSCGASLQNSVSHSSRHYREPD